MCESPHCSCSERSVSRLRSGGGHCGRLAAVAAAKSLSLQWIDLQGLAEQPLDVPDACDPCR
jgi:hypothetical protein